MEEYYSCEVEMSYRKIRRVKIYFDFCSIFNIAATLIYTYALWQKNTKTYKLLGIIVNALMIVYDVYIKSILGVILISIAFVSSIIGYYKDSKKNKI